MGLIIKENINFSCSFNTNIDYNVESNNNLIAKNISQDWNKAYFIGDSL